MNGKTVAECPSAILSFLNITGLLAQNADVPLSRRDRPSKQAPGKQGVSYGSFGKGPGCEDL